MMPHFVKVLMGYFVVFAVITTTDAVACGGIESQEVFNLVRKARTSELNSEELTRLNQCAKQEPSAFEKIRIAESESFLVDAPWYTPRNSAPTIAEAIDYYTYQIKQLSGQEEFQDYVKTFHNQRSQLIQASTLPALKRTIIMEKEIDQPLLLVTHASKSYDTCQVAKTGIDEIIGTFNDPLLAKIIYLVSPGTEVEDLEWYTCNRNPSITLDSESGNHPFQLKKDEVTIVGGFFGKCHLETVMNIITGYSGSYPLKIDFPMKAIYTSSGKTLLKEYQDIESSKFEQRVRNYLDMELSLPNYSSYQFEVQIRDHSPFILNPSEVSVPRKRVTFILR